MTIICYLYEGIITCGMYVHLEGTVYCSTPYTVTYCNLHLKLETPVTSFKTYALS